MNKINPQYLLLFFIAAAGLVWYQASGMEERLQLAQEENVMIEQEGKRLQGLKEKWKNSAASRKALDSIFGQTSLKPNLKKQEIKAGVYTVQLEKLEGRELEQLLNKVLNEPVSIKKIAIGRSGETQATLELECQL